MGTVPLKIYKTRLPGGFADPRDQQSFTILPGYNTPHSYEETTLEDLEANISTRNRSQLGDLYNQYKASISDYATDSQGRLTTNTAIQQQQQMANDPNMINVGSASAPMYVPKGSPGAANAAYFGTNITSNALNQGGASAQALVGQGIIQNLPSPSVPNYANQISNVPGIKIPEVTPAMGSISGATGAVAGLDAGLQALDKIRQEQEAAALKREELRSKETQSMFSKLLEGVKSPSAARTEAQSQTGIVPAEYFADQKTKIAEIGALTEEYNKVVAAKDAQIAQSYDKLGTTNFINNQIAQINRNAAPELNRMSANINAKVGVLQALQGNFAEAQKFVDQAVADATADNKFKMDLFNTTYQMNEDTLKRMDKIYSDSFTQAMTLATEQYKADVAEKKEVGNLMVQNPWAGISITDTLGQAQAKAASSYKKDPDYLYKIAQTSNIYADNARLGAEGGGGGGSVTTAAGKVLTGLDADAQNYLNGVYEDDDFNDKNYLLKVKSRANQLAQEALTSSAPTQNSTRAPITAYNTGKAASSAVKTLKASTPPTVKAISGIKNTVSSFFSGLFSR